MQRNKIAHGSHRWSVNVMQDSQSLLAIPNDVVKLILSYLNNFDAIMVRASCKHLFNAISEAHPFPKNFVLDQTACAEYFTRYGSVSCLEYLKNSLNFFFKQDLVRVAAEHHDPALLQYLINNGLQLKSILLLQPARTGNLAMLKYCLESISISSDEKSNLSKEMSRSAAHNGHVHILDYLHQHGYQFDDRVASAAVNSDHLECLKYLVSSGFRDISDHFAIRSLEMMKFLDDNGLEWKTNACRFAVEEHNLDMLKFARDHGAPWGGVLFVIEHGQFECLKYMIENGVQILQPITRVASLDILQYLAEHTNTVLSPELYSSAVDRVQKDVLEYLPKLGLARPKSLGVLAARTGDLEFLKWCIEVQRYDTDVKIYEQGGGTMDIMQAALSAGSLNCVKYVIENNLGPRTQTLANYRSTFLPFLTTVDIWEYMYNIEKFEITNYMTKMSLQMGYERCFELLDWMEQHGVVFTEWHFDIAMGSLASLAYLMNKGLKYPVLNGHQNGSILCYKYAIEHGCQWSPGAVNHIGDNVDLLRYMVHCGHVTLYDDRIYQNAMQNQNKKVLAYLAERNKLVN